MTTINLLPWRAELRQKRKKQFIAMCSGMALLGVLIVGGGWFFFNQELENQLQANQFILTKNQALDQKLKSLDGLQEQRNQVIERMRLIQGLQSQRPIVVRLIDELARVMPAHLFLTKFSRTGDVFTFEGKADSPNTVAEFLRNLEASPWYRNAFMNSFLAFSESKEQAKSSVIPRLEDGFGTFVVTANIAEPKSLGTEEQLIEKKSLTKK